MGDPLPLPWPPPLITVPMATNTMNLAPLLP